MGSSIYSSADYGVLKATTVGVSTDKVFKHNITKTISDEMSPVGLKFRESRDSEAHPNSFPVLVALDVTGSMWNTLEKLVRDYLSNLMVPLIDHGVKDAHVLFCAIGDHHTDDYPLQVGQFEAGAQELFKWLTSTYLEGGGGGHKMESYLLAWLLAARHTALDSFEKRGEKGVLFTMGDEYCHPEISMDYDASSRSKGLKEIMGYAEGVGITDKAILEEAKRMYNVFHIHIQEGSYPDDNEVLDYWKDMVPERLIVLDDMKTLAETIATTVAMVKGADMKTVLNSFSNEIADGVSKALVNVNANVTTLSEESNNLLNLEK